MRVTQWKDAECKVNRAFIELSPIQAKRIAEFLLDQIQEGVPAETHTERGVFEHFMGAGRGESYKGLFTIAIV